MLAAKFGAYLRLSDEERRRLAGLTQGRLRHFGVREDIIREGQLPTCVYFVVSGWACRYKILQDGRRQIQALFLPGDLCDPRIFILRRMDHSIATITAATVAEIPAEIIIEMTEGASRITRALWWSSLVNDAITREWLVSLGQRTARERVGHLFCELYLRQRAIGSADGMSCDLPLTQTELAEACGLSVVHLNRSLQDLRSRGLIELRRRSLIIRDFDRLASESMFDSRYLHLDREEDAITPPEAAAR